VILRRYEDVPVQYYQDRDLRALIDTTRIGLGRLSLAEETFQPGQCIPPHWHAGLEEVYHVKMGRGQMRVGDEVAEVRTGDTILIPVDTVHSLHNDGDEVLVLLCAVSPPWRADDHHLVEPGGD
jgi:mannose-6-phosphate isomerase-like protein (cupin superfamily)